MAEYPTYPLPVFPKNHVFKSSHMKGVCASCGETPDHSSHISAFDGAARNSQVIEDLRREIVKVQEGTVQQAEDWFDGVAELIAEKNKAYGDAWKKQGYLGNLGRIMSKTERLRNLLWREVEAVSSSGESVQDTLRDLAALAFFMARNYSEENKWGQ